MQWHFEARIESRNQKGSIGDGDLRRWGVLQGNRGKSALIHFESFEGT
jgi:hypothetical protein